MFCTNFRRDKIKANYHRKKNAYLAVTDRRINFCTIADLE